MFNKNLIIFPTLSLRPHWKQFLINEFWLFLCVLSAVIVATFFHFMYHEWLWLVAAMMGTVLMCKLAYVMRMEYIITAEQIIICKGILVHSTDYVELYRVVDYQQRSSFFQQLMGLKDVTIFSGDRNNPKVTMTGVQKEVDVVYEIRRRVEFNKGRKGIYEFTNQT